MISIIYLIYTVVPLTNDTFVSEIRKEKTKDWYALGIMLGLNEIDLKEIVWKHHLRDDDSRLRELFEQLQAQVPDKLTWEQIADALSTPAMESALSTPGMDGRSLAEHIVHTYCNDNHKLKSRQQVTIYIT